MNPMVPIMRPLSFSAMAKEEGKKSADFINCEVWEQLAELMVKYCSKGSKIAVEGRLEERTYDKQDGTKGYLTYVRVQNIEFLDSKPKETSGNSVQFKEENPFEEFGKSVASAAIELKIHAQTLNSIIKKNTGIDVIKTLELNSTPEKED